jgi:hypothetical protein
VPVKTYFPFAHKVWLSQLAVDYIGWQLHSGIRLCGYFTQIINGLTTGKNWVKYKNCTQLKWFTDDIKIPHCNVHNTTKVSYMILILNCAILFHRTWLFKTNNTVTSDFIAADKFTASSSTRRNRSAFIV